MKIILLQDLPGVGKKYDIKTVANGFARNFLLPRGKALPANPSNLTRLEQMRQNAAAEEQTRQETLHQDLAKIAGQTVTIEAAANSDGVLFAALHPKDVLAAVNSQHQVNLPDNLKGLPAAIKKVGEYELSLPATKVKLVVKPRGQP